MLEIRRGGHRQCPRCKQIVETRVLPEGYSQVEYLGVLAKQRKVICWKDVYGDDGCGHEWFTYELPGEVLGIDASSQPRKKRGRRHG
jgi:hypothetical protein